MSDLTGKRIPKQTLHGSISTRGSSNPLRGNVMTRGLDGYSPTVEFEETEAGIKVTITDVTGPHSAIIKPGPKGDRGEPGVYVGPGEMPEDCYIQIDPTGESIDVVTKKEFNDFRNSILDYIALPEEDTYKMIGESDLVDIIIDKNGDVFSDMNGDTVVF